MHKLLRILLVLALVTGQSAAHAHALSHLAHDLASARWQAFMVLAQHLHGPGASPERPATSGHDHPAGVPELDHGKDRCVAFSALDNSSGTVPAILASGLPPIISFVQRLWQFSAIERIPFSSRAPPLIS